MSAVEEKLRKMGYTLPPAFKFPNPNRTGCVVVGSIVFVSGHGRDVPSLPNVKNAGKVGRDLTVEEGYATARAVALSMLASLKQQLGDLDRIKRVVRLFGMVNAAPGFDRMPQVIDGASDFFLRAVRSGKWPARTLGGRPCGTAARHPCRDQWGVRASLLKMPRETGSRAGISLAIRPQRMTAPGHRSGLPQEVHMVARLRHIAISVPDPEKAAQFFEQAFGMKRAGKAGIGLYMSDGTVNVALLKFPGDVPGMPPGKPYYGLIHFGMWVDDLDEAAKQVEKAGGSYFMGREDHNPDTFYEVKYKDPNGVVFDLTHSGWRGAVKEVQPSDEKAIA
jgi:lactoylglutathione lyase